MLTIQPFFNRIPQNRADINYSSAVVEKGDAHDFMRLSCNAFSKYAVRFPLNPALFNRPLRLITTDKNG